MKPIMVFTDGACKGNPGMMGVGIVIIPDSDNPQKKLTFCKNLGQGTNNIAELKAVELALEEVEKLNDPRPVIIYSDSQYTVNVLKRFKITKNEELINDIKAKMLLYEPGVEITYIPGHQKNIHNELADRLASNAAIYLR